MGRVIPRQITMFKFFGDVLKKVLINVLTLAIILGLLYWFVFRRFL